MSAAAVACEACHQTRWKAVTVEGVERMVRCDCWPAVLAATAKTGANIPRHFSAAGLAGFEPRHDSQRDALRRAQAFVATFPAGQRGLLLLGPPGVGKTHLAAGVLAAVLAEKGGRGVFHQAAALLRLVRDTFNPATEDTELSVLAPILGADLLVLDDLGAEKASPWTQELLGLIINSRYNDNKPMIITTNLADSPDLTDPYSLLARIGARSRSRLCEMCHWIEMRGADARMTK